MFQKVVGLMAEASSEVPIKYVATSTLVKGLYPTSKVARGMPHSQGDPQPYQSPGPLKINPSVSVGGRTGLSRREEVVTDASKTGTDHLWGSGDSTPRQSA